MNDFPDWTGFTPEFAATELPRLIDMAEERVREVERLDRGQGRVSAPSYEEFVWPLADATRKLYLCWGMVSHMLGVMNSEKWRKVEDEWRPKVVAFSLRVGQSRRLYEIAKAIISADSLGSGCGASGGRVRPTRRRILEKMVQGAELAGVGLAGEKRARFNEIQMRLAKLGADFQNTVIDATAAFKYEKGGKTYTIDDANYPMTMKHCADREVREQIYKARALRAPENELRIVEILKLRQEEARILGFGNYAEKSLATKCAPSIDAVLKMIDDLDAATVKKAADEKLAVEPWDVDYEAERERERKYAYSEEELKRHFELEDVMKGLFRLTKFLFGVDVVEVADKPSVWHADVRFFAVREEGETIAHFYFDPFVRPGLKSGGAWMDSFRNRCKTTKVGGGVSRSRLPLALIVTNFSKRDKNGKCHLTFREMETIFHEFGHALQCMLTRIDEEDAAGIGLVEYDAVEIASQFMENWCLDDRTGIKVPAELKAKVRAAKNFRAATACRRQLAFAKTDMELYRRTDVPFCPEQFKNVIFRYFGIPLIEGDRFLCSLMHIFPGMYAAGYYGYKWAEVMSADCYGAFEEAGLSDDAAVQRLGRRYRETILALGGSKSALDVFRDFRGRDPEIKSMIRQQDLTAASEN